MKSIRTLLLGARAAFFRYSGLLWWVKRQMRQRGDVIVLMFHRVLDRPAADQACSLGEIVVSQGHFRKLCQYLARHCEVVSAGEAQPGRSSSKLRVMITFDDGWKDNFTTALPVLRSHDLPATIFVCPALAGQTFPFWPERMVSLLRRQPQHSPRTVESTIESWKHRPQKERDRYMQQLEKTAHRAVASAEATDQLLSWSETEALHREGIAFGSHTQHHEILPLVARDTAWRELRESKESVESMLDVRCDTLAYPNGDYSTQVRDIAETLGYRLAFTTERAAWTSETDPLLIPRCNMYDGNLEGLWGSFSRSAFEYTTFWKAWRATPRHVVKSAQAISRPAPQLAETPTEREREHASR